MAVTLKDVAKEAQVGVSTVSYVLSGSGLHKVGSDTCQRILEVAHRLHYRPNIQARSLCKGHTFIAGALIRQLTISFVPEIVEGLEEVLEKNGYCLILATYSTQEEFTQKCNYLYQHGVEAVAIIPLFYDFETADTGELESARIPIITIGKDFGNFTKIMVEPHGVGRQAVNFLASHGHRHIAYIGGYENRIGGMLEAQKNFPDLKIDFGPVLSADCERDKVIFDYFIKLSPRPTAIVIDSDIDAIAFMHLAIQAGLRIPEDISVLGVDGTDIGRYSNPPLTAVGQPTYEQGRCAAELMLNAIAGNSIIDKIMQPFIIERNSCRIINPD